MICFYCLFIRNPFGTHWLRILILIKISDLSKILDKIRNTYDIVDRYSGLFNFFLLFFKVLYLNHFLGCAWFGIGKI